MLRGVVKLAILAALIYFGATLTIGERTLFGHMRNIWASDETQELVDSVKDEVKDGLRAGVHEATRDVPPDAGIQTTQ